MSFVGSTLCSRPRSAEARPSSVGLVRSYASRNTDTNTRDTATVPPSWEHADVPPSLKCTPLLRLYPLPWSRSTIGYIKTHIDGTHSRPEGVEAGRAEGAVCAPVPVWHVRFLLPKFAEKTLKCSVRADILCMTKKEARSKPTTTGRCDSHHCWLRCARNIVHCSDLNTRECQTSATARLTKNLDKQRHSGALACLAC